MPHVKYFWDEMEDNVVEEYDGDTGNTIATYTTEPTKYGSVLSQDRSGEKRYFQFDGLGNTTELTDGAGNVTDERRYSAFGETAVSAGSTSTPFGYGGRWGYHASGGSPVSIRRRQYERKAARWMSVDPLFASDTSVSQYSYANNRPAVLIDPTGMFVIQPRDGNQPPNHGCTRDQGACITFVLEEIVRLVSAEFNCFARVQRRSRENPGCAPCRNNLAKCVTSSLASNVTFTCGHHGADHKAHARGPCVDVKATPEVEIQPRGRPVDANGRDLPPDPSCQACPRELLNATIITVNPRVIPTAARCTARFLGDDPLTTLARTLVHETIHLCVGGHLRTGHFSDTRPDAVTLAEDFLDNCWRITH